MAFDDFLTDNILFGVMQKVHDYVGIAKKICDALTDLETHLKTIASTLMKALVPVDILKNAPGLVGQVRARVFNLKVQTRISVPNPKTIAPPYFAGGIRCLKFSGRSSRA